MKIKIAIHNNSTDETRIYEKDNPEVNSVDDWYDTANDYLWRDGNYSCDCNRALFFSRAIGEDEDNAWDQQCGDNKYTVEYVELENGERINGIDS